MVSSASYTVFSSTQTQALVNPTNSSVRKVNSSTESSTKLPGSASIAPSFNADNADKPRETSETVEFRAVLEPNQIDPSRIQPPPFNEQDIREAQLVLDNPKAYSATRTFEEIQHFEDSGHLIDVYA